MESGTSSPVENSFNLEVYFDSHLSDREVRPEIETRNHFVVAVSEVKRPIRGEFGEQVLNRFFTEQYLRVRPKFVYIVLVCGATLDLIRLAKIFGSKVLVKRPEINQLPANNSRALDWLSGAISSSDVLVGDWVSGVDPSVIPQDWRGSVLCVDQVSDWMLKQSTDTEPTLNKSFDYGLYEFGLRDHGLLRDMQSGVVSFFSESKRVLDLACGAGIFLDLLAESGIVAEGVERNPALVKYARDIGFQVHESDAFEFLQKVSTAPVKYDGIHCSHFIEHLPIAAVEELIQLLYDALGEGGILVLIFPDPESIRSQLLGFWRDPEHVRFYHPDLIEIMARAVGFEPVYSNQKAVQRDVIGFPMHMRTWPTISSKTSEVQQSDTVIRNKWWRKLFNRFDIKSEVIRKENEWLRQRVEILEARSQASEQIVKTLWTVNQTWAWDDNATLCLRKPSQ
ncbi:class I SAM-dependent methyltransferase [Polynucleobacter sp. 35-46-11]|uniref:class I SAM-dependent methyltransferase n=1 Tax=Polynucleobacter sp. 35-46-11 TaxID=1970425 RepID=UPI0025D6191E|nr:class I SAM-dependent methyltransferase [Polynucleobacter sp. 35-46-11]